MNDAIIKKVIGIFCFIVFLIAISLFKTSSTTFYVFIIEYSFFGLLGILSFLFFRPKNEEYSELKYAKAFDILFFILFIVGIIILNNSLYVKNTLFYIIMALLFSIIGLKIVCMTDYSKEQKIIILFEIIMLGLIIRSSSAIINPYLFGADAYWHFNTISKMISNGFLDPLAGHYYYHPIAQIIATIWSIIIEFPHASFNAASIIINVIAIPIVYLIGREIIGEREGLMSSLLLSISVFHLFGSLQFSPQRLGVTFLLISLYALIRIKSDKRYWFLFWTSVLTTLFVHPVTAIVLAVGLGSYFIINKVIEKKKGMTPSPFLSYGVLLVGYLIFVNLMLFTTFVKSIFVPEHGESLVTHAVTSIKYTYIFYFELVAGYFGPAMMLFLGLLGGLILVQRKNKKIIPLFLFIILLNFIPVLAIFGSSFGFQPARLLSFSDTLLIIPAGFGIIYLLNNFKIGKINHLVLFILLLSISFFSITSYLINDDNTILTTEVITYPVHATESTLATHGYLMKAQNDNTIFIDSATSRYISDPQRGIYSLPGKNITMFNMDDFNQRGYYVLNVHYAPYGTYSMQGSIKLGNELVKKLYTKNKIYGNGVLGVFLK